MNLWEPKMCCCFKLRTGSLILGVMFLVCGCFSMIGGIQSLIMDDEEIEDNCDRHPNPEECTAEYLKFELGVTITSMVIACFHIIFSSLLIYGILKQKTAFFIPLMIVYAVQIGVMILAAVLFIVAFIILGLLAATLIFACIFGVAIFLETYFLLVIRAYYYEIKRVKGQVHMRLDEQNPETPPYSGPLVPPPYPGNEAPPYPGKEAPPYPGNEAPPYPGNEAPPYPGNEAPPYPGNEAPPYPGNEAPPYPGNEAPPYPGNEAHPYPGSDVPLYPDTKKLPE